MVLGKNLLFAGSVAVISAVQLDAAILEGRETSVVFDSAERVFNCGKLVIAERGKAAECSIMVPDLWYNTQIR